MRRLLFCAWLPIENAASSIAQASAVIMHSSK